MGNSTKAVPPEEPTAFSDIFSPCTHTIFIADDNGLDYRNEAFDASMKTKNQSSEEIEEGDSFDGWEEFTARVSLPDSVKFAMYEGPPSFYGTYIGFAPSDDS